MVASLTLFSCHSFGSSRRRLKASTNYMKGNKKMNFDEFKDQFTEDVKQALKDASIDAKVSTNTVNKMNESYSKRSLVWVILSRA